MRTDAASAQRQRSELGDAQRTAAPQKNDFGTDCRGKAPRHIRLRNAYPNVRLLSNLAFEVKAEFWLYFQIRTTFTLRTNRTLIGAVGFPQLVTYWPKPPTGFGMLHTGGPLQ
jgi:hypothetical protein